jgi:NAD(P)-dependent dehydrogenase (short-subunit alcohol dehydrogenase family)
VGRLEGRAAIVTGAGQGVGRGIALALAKEGASVAVLGRTLEKCARTVSEIEAAGGRGLALACDVAVREHVDAAVRSVVEAFGGVDVLVNNAHTSRPLTPIVETTDKDMALAFQGLHGTLYFMQACFPFLKERRGAVINLGSIAGTRGDPGFAAYAAAKEGVRALTRVAAREWGEHGVRVNVICPFSESPGIEYMIRKDPNFIPTLTASPDADYITGQTINVDGGMWIAP